MKCDSTEFNQNIIAAISDPLQLRFSELCLLSVSFFCLSPYPILYYRYLFILETVNSLRAGSGSGLSISNAWHSDTELAT